MPPRPNQVIRSSELRAARGKSRTSGRGEMDDVKAELTKVAEEARRKQAFYDAVTFYRDVLFERDVNITGALTVGSFVYAPSGRGTFQEIVVSGGGNIDATLRFDVLEEDVYGGGNNGIIRANAASGVPAIYTYGTATTTRSHCIFQNDNGDVGSITTNGSATAFNTSSDVSQKDNIVPAEAEAALARILAVTVHDFTWKADGKVGRGVLAHELQAVMPHAVTGNPGDRWKVWATVDEHGTARIERTLNDEPLEYEREEAHALGIEVPAPQMVDYSKLVPDLVLAAQALAAQNQRLAERVAALEP